MCSTHVLVYNYFILKVCFQILFMINFIRFISFQEELNQLANKIQLLEDDLTNNRNTINQLRDAVRQLSKGEANFQLPEVPMYHAGGRGDTEPKSGHLKVAEIKIDGAAAEVAEDECTFGNTPSGTDVDVQVRHLLSFPIGSSAPPSKNAVSPNIKHTRYIHLMSNFCSIHFRTKLKGCMYICLI